MSKKIIIIGQGIIGATTAFTLAQRDPSLDIVVMGSHPTASGNTASGASWGWVNAHTDNNQDYFEFRNRSRRMWHDLMGVLPNLAARAQPSLVFDLSDDAIQIVFKNHSEWGYDVSIVSRAEILTSLPAFKGAPKLALFTRDEVAVETEIVCNQLMSISGAKRVTTYVHGLIADQDRILGVMTDQGQMMADHVVLAAGHGTPAILRTVGIDYHLDLSYGLIVRTKPVATVLNTMIIGKDYHVRQCSDGALLIGGTFDQDQTHATHLSHAALSLCTMVEREFDISDFGVTQLEIDRFTLGKRVLPVGGFPQIGRVSPFENLISMAMHGGVTNAPIAADICAGLILKDPRAKETVPFNFTKSTG